MKKIILFLLILFATGCSAEYNLTLTPDLKSEEMFALNSYKDYSLDEYDYIYNELENINSEISNKILITPNGSDSYEANIIDDGIDFGFSLRGTFREQKSNMIDRSCTNYDYKVLDDKISISAQYFNIFDEYSDLESLTINLKCGYNVLKNNSDSHKDGVYTWKIDRNNYKNKSIIIEYTTKEQADNPILIFTGLIIALAICGYLIYRFVKRISNNSNSV